MNGTNLYLRPEYNSANFGCEPISSPEILSDIQKIGGNLPADQKSLVRAVDQLGQAVTAPASPGLTRSSQAGAKLMSPNSSGLAPRAPASATAKVDAGGGE